MPAIQTHLRAIGPALAPVTQPPQRTRILSEERTMGVMLCACWLAGYEQGKEAGVRRVGMTDPEYSVCHDIS
jgi:hypothetical protein